MFRWKHSCYVLSWVPSMFCLQFCLCSVYVSSSVPSMFRKQFHLCSVYALSWVPSIFYIYTLYSSLCVRAMLSQLISRPKVPSQRNHSRDTLNTKHCQRHNGPRVLSPWLAKSFSTKIISNWFQSEPDGIRTCISCKFGHQMALLALVVNFATK